MIILLVFSFQRRVGLWGSVSQPVTTYAAIIAGSVFSCAILHMLFIWPCDCLMSKWPRLRLTKYVDDFTISYRGMNHTVADVITEALSSLVGWLENGLDFHVSKDEKGAEGKSVVLVSNASLKAALTTSTKALGMRVVTHARILGVDAFGVGGARRRRTQYAWLTKIRKRMPKVQFYKKYGAMTSKIAKAGLMPSALHTIRCMGMPPTRLKAFRTTIGRCLPGKHAGRRTFTHLAAGDARVRSDTHVQGGAHRGMAEAIWDEQLNDVDLHRAWRRQQRMEGLKPSWSKSLARQGPSSLCLKQLGWSWPHHTTFVTANGHEIDLRQICPRDVKAQALVDSELALWKDGLVTVMSGKSSPVPVAGTRDSSEQTSSTSAARGASD